MITFAENGDNGSKVVDLDRNKPSELQPDKFFIGYARQIDNECEREEKIRTEKMVTMCKRHRGGTPADLFGAFRNGVWLEHPAFDSLHGTNIFQALVRGAEANFTQATPRLDIKASSNNFNNRSAKKVAKGIYDILLQKQWNETAQSEMFYAGILKLNYILISRFNRGIDEYKIRVPEFKPIEYEKSGLAVCNECSTPVPYSNLTESKCEKCGSESLTVIKDAETIQDEVVSDFKEYPAGGVELLIADGYDFRIDDSSTKSCQIKPAKWAEYHYLVHKSELQKLYPHLKLKSSPEWTYQTQWKMAFKRYASSNISPNSKFDKEQYELREIWLDKTVCEAYISPIDYQIGDFKIKAGQRLSDVCPDGCVFGIVGDEIAFVFNENKNDVLTAGCWLSDPMSFWGLGASAGLPIQRKINQLDNINMQGISRSMFGSAIYRPTHIDGAALEGSNTNIPLRLDADEQKSLDDVIRPLEIKGLSGDVMAFLGTQHDTIQKIMGVPDAAIGEADSNNQTMGGQQLLTQRAVGLLIPAKKSQANAMEDWLLQQAKLIQTYYSTERIKEEFGSAFGEEWLDSEVEAFRNVDLDKALVIKYAEGSEVPQTRQEKEAKLFAMVSGGIVPPTPDVIAKLSNLAGIDEFDVGNYESNTQLAQSRWTFVKEGLQENPQIEQLYQQMESMMLDETGARAVDEMGNKIPNPLVLQLIQAPELTVIAEAEEHNLHIEFWSDKTRGLQTGSNKSAFLTEICVNMIRQHEMAMFKRQTQMNAVNALTEAPVQVGGKLLDQATNPPEEKTNESN